MHPRHLRERRKAAHDQILASLNDLAALASVEITHAQLKVLRIPPWEMSAEKQCELLEATASVLADSYESLAEV